MIRGSPFGPHIALIRFLLAGGTAAIANVLVRIVLSTFFPFEFAVALAYLVGLAIAFSLSRRYVFESSGRPILSEVARFTCVNVVSLSLVVLVSSVLLRFVFRSQSDASALISHLIALSATAFTSYFLHKHYTFKSG
jgi:putative flippase GtrA